jgi:hypothetical protein
VKVGGKSKLATPTLKMEAIFYSGTYVDFQCTTHQSISEDSTLHNGRFKKLKFYMDYIFSPKL